MLAPWLQTTVTVRRRTANPSRNTLNEPNYGLDTAYPIVYTGLQVRFEFQDVKMRFVDPGERVEPDPLFMYIDSINPADGTTTLVYAEDRVFVTSSDGLTLINTVFNYFIVESVMPEWDAMGNVHHYVGELSVH